MVNVHDEQHFNKHDNKYQHSPRWSHLFHVHFYVISREHIDVNRYLEGVHSQQATEKEERKLKMIKMKLFP